MREDDDEFRHYVPLLRRIIILVAVITAVPVVLWTITAFVRTYVGLHDGKIIGYYSLAFGEVKQDIVPQQLARGMGKYRFPAIILGRLAVHKDYQGKKIGVRDGGSLRDISPTILGLMELELPKQMTGGDLRVVAS